MSGKGGTAGRAVARVSRAAIRAAAQRVPAERRDWAEASWAEAGQVPSLLERLA